MTAHVLSVIIMLRELGIFAINLSLLMMIINFISIYFSWFSTALVL